MIYVYAVTDQPEKPPPPVKGLDDAPIHLCPCGRLAAAISLAAAHRPDITEAAMWRHEAVLEALMDDRAVLPVRFGTVIADEAALRETLQSRCEAFAANLDLVRGQVEIALRVLDPTPLNPPFVRRGEDGPSLRSGDCVGVPSPLSRGGSRGGGQGPGASRGGSRGGGQGPGAAYLSQRLEERRWEQDWLERSQGCRASVEEALDRLVTRSVWRRSGRPPTLLQSAHLIDRGNLEELRDRVNNLREANRCWRFLCTGPWPPFSFVERTISDEMH